jgi:hypothetical protein
VAIRFVAVLLFCATAAPQAISRDADTTSLDVAHRSILSSVIDASDNEVGHYLSIAMPRDGRAVLAYQDVTDGTLKVAKCRNRLCRGRAVVSTVHAPGNRVGSHTSIAIGAAGLPVIAHHDETATALIVTACHDAACRRATHSTVDADGDVGSHASIAIAADGNPIISYFESASSASSLKVAKCTDRACSNEATITRLASGLVGEYSSIAVGADGLPVISFHDFNYGQLMAAKCQAPDCSGSSMISVLAGGPAGDGKFSRVAILPNGLPVISHAGFAHIGMDVGWALKLLRCADPACTIASSHAPIEHFGVRPSSLAVGRNGQPVIGYIRDDELRLAHCRDSECSEMAVSRVETVLPQQGFDTAGLYAAVAVGHDGAPVIAFHSDGAVLVAKCANAGCQ